MSQADRDAIMKECTDETVAKAHADVCKMAMSMTSRPNKNTSRDWPLV